MSPEEYKAARQERGTQESVAALLGVARSTVADRERGDMKITREAELALLSLRKKPQPRKRPNADISYARVGR